jgi:Tfp pilus assembly protein PilP
MTVRAIIAAVMMALLVLLVGCTEEPVTAPSTQEYTSAVEQAKAARARAQEKLAGAPSEPAAGVVLEEGESNLEDGFGTMDEQYAYDPSDMRDPFRSFQYMNEEEPSGAFGPLGDYELQQLSVVAVVWDTGKPRALVADPGGRSFIVHEGSQIGKNNGRVIHIGDNLVLVKETYVNFAGEQTTKDVEMRIRRSQGG